MSDLSISNEELKHHNKSKKGSSSRVCISAETHKKLRQFAADCEVSMQAVVECLVEKLPER